jgi:hypothetical protein
MDVPTGRHEATGAEAEYRLRLGGVLGNEWSDWFDGLALSVQDGTTILSGRVRDQAALHSLLARVRDLGIPLLSVERIGD